MLIDKEGSFYFQDQKVLGLEHQGYINFLFFKENYMSVTGFSPSIESAKKKMVNIINAEGSEIYADKDNIDFMNRLFRELIERQTGG